MLMETNGTTPRDALAAVTGARLTALRDAHPLVQMITNFVSMDMAANVLLAAGAAPAMVFAPEESPDFVRKASALVVNTGTLSAAGAQAMEVATTAARTHGVPWVLDPVGAGATRFRDDTITRLLRHRPTVIRGNASEIIAVARLAGLTQDAGAPRGVDSAHETWQVEGLATTLARHGACIVAATGAIDIVTDGHTLIRLANGSPLMTKVTALGCALTGYVGAFVGLGGDPFEATVSALAAYAVAGDIAAEQATGPATFRMAFIDALYGLHASDVQQRLRLG
jgi:hydroxyethylthiazole kinase